MRVRNRDCYIYDPCLLDICDGRTNLQKGNIVRVKNLPGCPPCNTMRHAHVVDPDTDKFIGLVCTGSLRPMSDLDAVIAELKVELTKKAAERGVSLC